jgi:tRNA(fMet)-specific endonuclease VapC
MLAPASAPSRIAATVLAHDALLITGNTRHFERIPGLGCENWLRG